MMTETNLKEILKTLFSADYFDLIENGNDNYVLYDTWTGYCTVLNENGDIPANWW